MKKAHNTGDKFKQEIPSVQSLISGLQELYFWDYIAVFYIYVLWSKLKYCLEISLEKHCIYGHTAVFIFY